MSPVRYRLSFQTEDVSSGWIQAVAQECVVRIQREVPRYGYARGGVTTDHLPLEMVADHVARHGMQAAELVFGGIIRREEAFLDWVNRHFRAPPACGALVVAQFNDPEAFGGWEGWRGWARYDHAVAMTKATVTGLEIEECPEMRVHVMRLTVSVLDLHQSQYPSPIVPPPDLLPGTIWYPYIPLQISSAWPTEEAL